MTQTPTDHINKKLLEKTDLQKVVLLGTGSYNPVHRGHIELFKLVKDQLEKEHKLKVLGAYISPSHDHYVKSKLGKNYIDSKHRVNMIELAIKEAGYDVWLCCDKWEVEQDGFFDFPEVTMRMKTFITKKYPNENIRVIYCAGSDHVEKLGCHSLGSKEMGVASIARPGYKQTQKSHVFNISTEFDYDISSTMIRKKIQSNEDLEKLEYKTVIQYMKDNKILFH